MIAILPPADKQQYVFTVKAVSYRSVGQLAVHVLRLADLQDLIQLRRTMPACVRHASLPAQTISEKQGAEHEYQNTNIHRGAADVRPWCGVRSGVQCVYHAGV